MRQEQNRPPCSRLNPAPTRSTLTWFSLFCQSTCCILMRPVVSLLVTSLVCSVPLDSTPGGQSLTLLRNLPNARGRPHPWRVLLQCLLNKGMSLGERGRVEPQARPEWAASGQVVLSEQRTSRFSCKLVVLHPWSLPNLSPCVSGVCVWWQGQQKKEEGGELRSTLRAGSTMGCTGLGRPGLFPTGAAQMAGPVGRPGKCAVAAVLAMGSSLRCGWGLHIPVPRAASQHFTLVWAGRPRD